MEKDMKLVENLESCLSEIIPKAKSIRIAVALCGQYAVDMLAKADTNCDVKIVTGIDLPTPVSVLRNLRSLYGDSVRVWLSGFYHPKVYIIKFRNDELVAYIGSGNFTNGGLKGNVELFYTLTSQKDCMDLWNWYNSKFVEAFVISDNFLRQYEAYSKKYEESNARRKKAFKKFLDETTKDFKYFDELKKELLQIRRSKVYATICKKREDVVGRIRKALDYDNRFNRIDLEEFYNIKELGNIRKSYKKELVEAIKDGSLKKLFMMLCDDRIDVEERFRRAMEEDKIRGCGKNVITKVLAAHNAKEYMLWNNVSEEVIGNYDRCFSNGRKKSWEKYKEYCQALKKIREEIDIVDFAVLDLMLMKVSK